MKQRIEKFLTNVFWPLIFFMNRKSITVMVGSSEVVFFGTCHMLHMGATPISYIKKITSQTWDFLFSELPRSELNEILIDNFLQSQLRENGALEINFETVAMQAELIKEFEEELAEADKKFSIREMIKSAALNNSAAYNVLGNLLMKKVVVDRNVKWAESIQQLLENSPGCRIGVVCGFMHLCGNFSLQRLIVEKYPSMLVSTSEIK